MVLRGWRSHCHRRQRPKPPEIGTSKDHGHGRGRQMGIVADLFLGMQQESRSRVPLSPHITHTQVLVPGWKGQGPQAAQDHPRRVYHSFPETVIKIWAQTNLTQSVPALDYRTINPNYREVSMRDNWKRNTTLLLPWSCHPRNPSAAKQHGSKTRLDEQIRLDGERIRSICNEQHQFACQQ